MEGGCGSFGTRGVPMVGEDASEEWVELEVSLWLLRMPRGEG